jgi:hypothetical protein
MARKFARLRGVNTEADKYAQEHNRRPFVFGFVSEHGTAVYRDGSVPVGADGELSAIWTRLCQLVQAESMDDVKRLDAAKLKSRK